MPIGKKPTLRKISFQRNSTIKRFGFPNDTTDCILRIRTLTFFRLRPFRINVRDNILPRTLFFFANILPKLRTLTHVIKADRTFIIWTQRESTRHHTQRRTSRSTTRSYSDVKLRKTHQVNIKIVNWRKKNDMKQFKISFRTTNRFWKRRQKKFNLNRAQNPERSNMVYLG